MYNACVDKLFHEMSFLCSIFRTPIHWAAAFGQVQCVEVLLELGVNAAVLDADGGSPLFYATQSGHSGQSGVIGTAFALADVICQYKVCGEVNLLGPFLNLIVI